MKEDLYTAYYALSEKDEIVGGREIEIPQMKEDNVVEKEIVLDTKVTRMDSADSHNEDGV